MRRQAALRCAACGRSWQICVKNARRGASFSTDCRDRSTVECVGCGRCRRASRNSTSSPLNCSIDSSAECRCDRLDRRRAQSETHTRVPLPWHKRMGMNSSPNRSMGAPSKACGDQARDARIPLSRRRKCSGNSAGCCPMCFGDAVNRNFAALPEIERTYIVQAHDMVGVRVGEQDGVDAFDLRAQRLLAEVGRGVDQDAVPAVLDIEWTAAAGCRAGHRRCTRRNGIRWWARRRWCPSRAP